MKRRVAYFLLCVCFCFSSLSLSSSAVEYDDYYGYELISDEDQEGVLYSIHEPMQHDPFSLLYIEEEPNYPDFDMALLPWLDMPSYVHDIINAEPLGLVNDTSYSGEYKLPFVYVQVGPDTIDIIAGYNLCIGTYFQNEQQKVDHLPYRVFIIALKLTDVLYRNAVCYHASYSADDYSLMSEWKSLDPVAVGDHIVRYFNINYDYWIYDRYLYGSNGLLAGRILQTTKINAGDDDMYPQYVVPNNPVSGFASGTYGYMQDMYSGYWTSFSPPSAEALQQATSKGIWETIKELPTKITDIIKGFFLPAEGFFDTYTAEFQDYFKDRFGLLYELPDAVIGILQQFVDYSPAESGYSITFPEVVMPVLDNGEWYDKVIIEETDITFDFLEQGAFATLYSMYRSVIWMIFIFALINLIIRKSERVFGGSG